MTGRTAIAGAFVVCAALLLGACAVQPPVETPAPVVSASGGPPSPSSPPQTGATVANPPTVGTPQGALLLAPNALGPHAFGTSEATVLADLKGRFGQPEAADEGLFCEANPDSVYEAVYGYGGLMVTFAAKDRSAASPRTLAGWTYILSDGLDPAFEFADDLPADPTFAQLAQKYPTGTLITDEVFGTTFTLPNGIEFNGDPEPEFVGTRTGQGGCE